MSIEWKKVLLFAIVPAVIAGFFSVAPKLYDIATEPKAELTYTIVAGPELQVQDGFQKIISIAVQNTGKRALSNVTSSLNIGNGKIEAYKVQEFSGLKPLPVSGDRELSLTLKNLHPDEKYTISILVLSGVPGMSPQFTLRSDEVLGQRQSMDKKENKEQLPFYGAFLVAISVFVMSIAGMKKARGISRFEMLDRRQDVIFYIPIRLGLYEVAKQLQLSDVEVTYLRLADIVLLYGLSSEGDKSKAILALKCLLLVNKMAELSRETVIHNLKILQDQGFDQRHVDDLIRKGKSVGGMLDLRRLIDEQAFATDC